VALRTAAARLGTEHLERIPHAVVPYLNRPLEPLSEARRRRFAAHLDAAIAAAFDPSLDPQQESYEEPDDAEFSRRTTEATDPDGPLDASCAACRGVCCLAGGQTQAFLSADSIRFVRHHRPDLSQEDVRTLYQSYLPDDHVQDSCIYHGSRGCTLPRTLRADVCNRWQCTARRSLKEQPDQTGAAQAVVAALAGDHMLHPHAEAPIARVVTAGPGGISLHSDLTVGALEE